MNADKSYDKVFTEAGIGEEGGNIRDLFSATILLSGARTAAAHRSA